MAVTRDIAPVRSLRIPATTGHRRGQDWLCCNCSPDMGEDRLKHCAPLNASIFSNSWPAHEKTRDFSRVCDFYG